MLHGEPNESLNSPILFGRVSEFKASGVSVKQAVYRVEKRRFLPGDAIRHLGPAAI